MVTDIRGNTFQHHEYFPTGEVWVDEKSTVFRTPYQYAGGYVDEVRKVISIGARFYDQNRGSLLLAGSDPQRRPVRDAPRSGSAGCVLVRRRGPGSPTSTHAAWRPCRYT